MIFITIPKWANYIVVRMDKTIRAYRYDPATAAGREEAANDELGFVSGSAVTGTTKLNTIIENEQDKPEKRYINNHFQIVTKENEDYKAFTLRMYIFKTK